MVEIDLELLDACRRAGAEPSESPLEGIAIATGSLGRRLIELSNRGLPVEVKLPVESPLRLARAAEVFRLALHWFAGWDHLGCVDLEESAFFDSVLATVFVVDSPDAWLNAGAQLPALVGVPDAQVVVFLGWEGRDVSLMRFQRAVERLGVVAPDITLAAGVYVDDTPGERCLLGLGLRVEPVERSPEPSCPIGRRIAE